MDKKKIYKIVLLGSVVITLPFILAIFYFLFYSTTSIHIVFKIAGLTLGYFYWALMAPWYRMYSIERLNNGEEYFIWKRLSIYSMILWPDNFIGTKYEMWSDDKYKDYKAKIKDLDVC